jgi:hypothetical protein
MYCIVYIQTKVLDSSGEQTFFLLFYCNIDAKQSAPSR